MKSLAAALLLLAVALAGKPSGAVNDAAIIGQGYAAHLSDYGFFADLKTRTPAARVTPYTLNTPLFSDYAEKHRYIYLPSGQSAKYEDDAVLDFPVGTALIKTFGYQQNGVFRPLETRLLLRRATGWVAIPYVWNPEGTDADLKRAGTRIPVSFTDPSGEKRDISYAVPNQNQCKDCHALDGKITPIGPRARQLNDGDQLQALVSTGILDRAPANAPRLARWDDPRASLDDRARAYLEINCAHCHNPRGAASNSGLYLDWRQPSLASRGVLKRPVAAGRGSGEREFDIVPGNAQASILPFRMESTDPGIAMPELGRGTIHKEGVKLVRDWIDAMPKDAH